MNSNIFGPLKKSEWKKMVILILLSIIFIYLFIKQINNVEGLSESKEDSILLHMDEKVNMKTCEDKDTTDFSKINKEIYSEIEDSKDKYISKLKSILENNDDGNYVIASSIYQSLQDIFIINQWLKSSFIGYKHTYINIKCQKNKTYKVKKAKFKQDLLKTFRNNPDGRMIRTLVYYIRRRIKFRNQLLRFIDINKKYLDAFGDTFKKDKLIQSTEMKEVDVFIDKLEEKIKEKMVDELERNKTYNQNKEEAYTKKLLDGKLHRWDIYKIDNLMVKNEDMNLDILNMGYTVPKSLSSKEDIPEEESKFTPPSGSSMLKKDLEDSSKNIKKNGDLLS